MGRRVKLYGPLEPSEGGLLTITFCILDSIVADVEQVVLEDVHVQDRIQVRLEGRLRSGSQIMFPGSGREGRREGDKERLRVRAKVKEIKREKKRKREKTDRQIK